MHRTPQIVPTAFALAVFLLLLAAGCQVNDQRADQNTNKVDQPVENDPSNVDLIELDAYEFVDAHLSSDMKAILEKIAQPPLPDSAPPERSEIRLWTNLGGLGDVKLLILRSNGSEKSANFFEIQRALDPARFRRESSAGPASGWDKLLTEVRSRLRTPNGLSRDPLDFQ